MMAAFSCQVCFTEKSKRLALPQLRTQNGDQLRAGDCNHPVCVECMAAWVTSRVEEQRVFNIRCPGEGCKNELHEQDVSRLVQSGALPARVAAQLAELRARDYSARAHELSTSLTEKLECQLNALRARGDAPSTEEASAVCSSYAMVQRLEKLRLCPRCHVAIEKSEGCNDFGCICGHRFDFGKAPRACTGPPLAHLEKFDRVVSLLKQGVPFRTAELRVRAVLQDTEAQAELAEARRLRKASNTAAKVSAALGLSLEDAKELTARAEGGDEAAWLRIREARRLRTQREALRSLRILARAAPEAERSASDLASPERSP